jgi:hypothetical protein
MKGGNDMTYKQIEASRETRLWLTQIIVPIATVVMMVPETRNAVVTKTKKVKETIKSKFAKK